MSLARRQVAIEKATAEYKKSHKRMADFPPLPRVIIWRI